MDDTAPEAAPVGLAQVRARSAVDYMLRTAQQNQMALAALADQKANIVLGLTFLILTLSATRYAQGPIPTPLLLLLVAAILAGLFATAALIPRAPSRRRRAGDPAPVAANPLFFDGIATLPPADYRQQMTEVMLTDEGVYAAIVADLHAGACALRKKYRWLRYSYLAFVIGLSLSGAAWVAEWVLEMRLP